MLIEVAARCFARHGYDGASIRDIVREANVNLGAVTYHFGGKANLFAAVMAAKIEPLRRMGERIMGGDGDPEDKLRLLLHAYAMRVLHDDPGMKALLAEMVLGGDRLPAFAIEAVALRNRMFAEVVHAGIRGGRFRDCDVEEAAWMFFGMLSAYILYRPLAGGRGGGKSFSRRRVEHIVDTAMELFMHGLIKRPSAGVERKRR
jgi:AcrR family transcriptional regulator